MKRHPALAHLSRDHHGALILARLLQKDAPAYKGLPADAAGKTNYALQFYNDELVKHFTHEEKVFKLVAGIHSALDVLIRTIFDEHHDLHLLFKLIKEHPGIETHLDELGKALEMHIRKEERELFPLIQETCDEPMMMAIDKMLTSPL